MAFSLRRKDFSRRCLSHRPTAHATKNGVAEHLPAAQVVFGRFHVMKLAGEAVDGVRKELRAQGADLKGALWAPP
jgi:transposase